MAVAMRVLDAQVETMKADGNKRSIPIADFHRLPGDTPHVETALEPGELITSVTLPPPVRGKHIYRKVRDRASYAFALISVATVVRPDGAGRIALGGVAHKPWRLEEADEQFRVSSKSASAALLAQARSTDQNRFKINLVERTLAAVYEEARG